VKRLIVFSIPRPPTTERLGGFEIDNEFELDRLLDRKIGTPCALQYPIDVIRGAPNDVGIAHVVGHQTTEVGHVRPIAVHRRQFVASREVGHARALGCEYALGRRNDCLSVLVD
jgi:hypothetical protein